MKPKPSTCKGCPLYQGEGDTGYVPDEIHPTSPYAILAQAPGANEEYEARPMVGRTGQMQDAEFLPLIDLERKDVSVLNVLKCRWQKGGRRVDELPSEPTLTQAIEHCTTNHLVIPEHITHVIAQGALALRHSAGRPLPMHDWRGHVVSDHKLGEGRKVYAVEHLANLFRDPNGRWVTELDWRRAGRFIKGTWPLPIPPRTVYGADIDVHELSLFEKDLLDTSYIGIDTEYVGGGHPHDPGYLTLLGIGWLGRDGVITGAQFHWEQMEPWARGYVSELLHQAVRKVPIVFQNAVADMPVLKKNCGIGYAEYARIDDTMLAHAVLYSELRHTLEFCDSIYGWFPKLKHLKDTDPLLYNWGDVLSTIALWEGLKRSFETDREAYVIYESQSLALLPIILRSMETGIRVDKNRLFHLRRELEEQSHTATAVAQTHAGWPINLGSDDQVMFWAYVEKGYDVQEDPDTHNPTVSGEAVAILREVEGPTIAENEDPTIETLTDRIARGGDPVLEARAVYQASQHLLDAYIYPLHKRVYNAVDKDARKRAMGAIKSTVWAHDDIVDRAFPHLAIHPQKTGRWSITDPPMAQLPEWMRNLYIPDPGHVWVEWDWSSIEAHILEMECQSTLLRGVHDKGYDGHVLRMCNVLGYDLPPNLVDPHKSPECEEWRRKYNWQGSDDGRRVFVKSATYEMFYGGTGATAARKASKLGFKPEQIKAMVSKLLTADQDYYRWRLGIEERVRRTRIIRTFMGRPRRFLGVAKNGSKVSAKVVREALNHPMQGGNVDIFNTTLIALCEKYPVFNLMYGMHDSQKHQVARELVTPDMIRGIESVVTRPFMIKGREKCFPAKFKLITPPGEEPLDWGTLKEVA